MLDTGKEKAKVNGDSGGCTRKTTWESKEETKMEKDKDKIKNDGEENNGTS